MTPTSLSFSSELLGTSSTPRSVTVQSSGTGPLQVNSVAVVGAVQPDEQLQREHRCRRVVHDFGDVLAHRGRLRPPGSLTVMDNAGTQTVSLSGTGSGQITVSASSLNLGIDGGGQHQRRENGYSHESHRRGDGRGFGSIAETGPFTIASNTCGASAAPAEPRVRWV